MDEINVFYNKLSKIKYGWHDKKNNVYLNLKDGNFRKKYKMQKTKNIINSGYAICWEMCELQRRFFHKHNIKSKTIFAFLSNSKGECHTFSIFYLNDKCYWFEASWKRQKGIHEFNSLDEILEFYRNNFGDFTKKKYNEDNIIFYEYKRPLFRYSCNLFYLHCRLGKKIS